HQRRSRAAPEDVRQPGESFSRGSAQRAGSGHRAHEHAARLGDRRVQTIATLAAHRPRCEVEPRACTAQPEEAEAGGRWWRVAKELESEPESEIEGWRGWQWSDASTHVATRTTTGCGATTQADESGTGG